MFDAHPAVACFGEDDLGELGTDIAQAISTYNQRSVDRNKPRDINHLRFAEADIAPLLRAATFLAMSRDSLGDQIMAVGSRYLDLYINPEPYFANLSRGPVYPHQTRSPRHPGIGLLFQLEPESRQGKRTFSNPGEIR